VERGGAHSQRGSPEGNGLARAEDLSFAPTTCLRYSMSVDIRGTLVMAIWIAALTLLSLPLVAMVAVYVIEHNFNIAADGKLTHEEYIQLSSQEAKLLRVCQLDAVLGRFGGPYAPYAKLKAAQQRKGQPTMPKFVDPGDPPSFQETMWKKGYKCQEDDWLSYVEE
jgi:hypothetical protein